MKDKKFTHKTPESRLDIWSFVFSALIHFAIIMTDQYWLVLLPEPSLHIEWADSELTGFGNSSFLYEPMPLETYVEEEVYEEEEEIPEEVLGTEFEPSTSPKFEDILPDYVPPTEEIQQPQLPTQPSSPPTPISPRPPLQEDTARLASIQSDIETLPQLQDLGPGNARLIVLLRTDRIKGTSFEPGVRRLLKSFPDYRVTLGTSQIDPLESLDALLIATSNPRLFASTFLGVRHHLPPSEIRSLLNQSFPAKLYWSTHKGKPIGAPNVADGEYPAGSGIYRRSIYMPHDNLLFFLQPQYLTVLDNLTVPKKINKENQNSEHFLLNNDESEKNLEEPTIPAQQTVLQYFVDIEKVDTTTQPALFLMVRNIQNLSLGRGFPQLISPLSIQGTLSMAKDPHLNLALLFDNEENATSFRKTWPQVVAAAGRMGIPGLSGMLAGIEIAQKAQVLYATGDLNGTAITLMLIFAAKSLSSL